LLLIRKKRGVAAFLFSPREMRDAGEELVGVAVVEKEEDVLVRVLV
jgi:hypothetical protein